MLRQFMLTIPTALDGSVFRECVRWAERTNSLFERARATLSAGSAFDFIFPELLSEAKVVAGKITFGDTGCDRLIAPTDIAYSIDETTAPDSLERSGWRARSLC